LNLSIKEQLKPNIAWHHCRLCTEKLQDGKAIHLGRNVDSEGVSHSTACASRQSAATCWQCKKMEHQKDQTQLHQTTFSCDATSFETAKEDGAVSSLSKRATQWSLEEWRGPEEAPQVTHQVAGTT